MPYSAAQSKPPAAAGLFDGDEDDDEDDMFGEKPALTPAEPELEPVKAPPEKRVRVLIGW